MTASAFTVAQILCSQGTFQNLDFELANVPDIPQGQLGGPVPVTNGVPGWGVSPGNGGLGMMFHNDISLGGADVEIFGPQWRTDWILEGLYTVGLFHSTFGPPTDASIFQAGQIPPGTHSIQFFGSGQFTATFAGQNISLISIATGPNYTIIGGDISGFGGQIGELRFTGNGLLDNIIFSSQYVPEAGSIALLCAAGATLLCSRSLRLREPP